MKKSKQNILFFKDITKNDTKYVGGKGANLGEMTSFLGDLVPNGFVVTAKAYFDFVKHNNLKKELKKILKSVNTDDSIALQKAAEKVQKIILKGEIPDKLVKEIIKSYNKLGKKLGLKQALTAIRSSATAEDLPGASFAGQQETFLNIRGEANVINHVRKSWASLFTPRAIFYREQQGFDHFSVGLAAVVQKMVQSDISGVMFTIDPVTNQKDKIVIEAIYGLGEYIVQGTVSPDHYEINKKEFDISNIKVTPQKFQLKKVNGKTIKTRIPNKLQKLQKLNSLEISELGKIGDKIHQHYFFPQDIEWAKEKDNFYIVQTRPVTTLKNKKQSDKNTNVTGELVLTGDAASPGISQGSVVIIKKASEINKVKKGNILVTNMTAPDYVPAMKRAAGIITNLGGLTSHAAIVSRELGVPCIVGTKTATKLLNNNDHVVVDGDQGEVWIGSIDKTKNKKRETMNKGKKRIKTATNLYLNLAEPELAKEMSQRDVDGVGLLRAEFMIAQIGKHPQKLIADNKEESFIKKLTEGLLKFCQAFNPRPVIYRATDFKTNEYRHLEGGDFYEPEESNPLIGFRGALRYISLPQVFNLEIEAIKRVRQKHGFRNLSLMIPFVHTPNEMLEVKRILAAKNLARGASFKLWMMVEIPSNVILLKEFIKTGIDGVSIGSNDLTMLTLGIDRDNNEIAYRFNEMHPAVLKSLKKIIKTCNKEKITCSICGQAPSLYPDLVEKLVKWGITSISVSPDAITRTREMIAHAEYQKINKHVKN